MPKWIPLVFLLIVLAVIGYNRFYGVKTSYINGLPAYSHLPGQEYIFQEDCYIFKLTDRDTSYPLVGNRRTVPALPADVRTEAVGTTVGGVRLLDVVSTGTRFRIVSVRRDESRRGTLITFEILLQNEQQRAYPRLDAEFLLDATPTARGEAPRILPEYAVARVKG